MASGKEIRSGHHHETDIFARTDTCPDEKRKKPDKCQKARQVLPYFDEIHLRLVKFFSDDRVHVFMIPRRAA